MSEPLTAEQLLRSIWVALRRIETNMALPPAPLELPAPVVNVTQPDLAEIVTAVTSLKPGPTADEIAAAIASVISPSESQPDGSAALESVAAALEKLDFRLKGMGTQAYGGGSVTLAQGTSFPISAMPSQVSTANSVLGITLDADEEWVGDWEEITGWSLITYAHNGSPAAATGSIKFEFSFDQTQVDVTAGELQNSGVGLSAPHTLIPVGRWIRLRYTNGSTPLTDFRFQTMLHSSKSGKLTRFPIQTMTDYDDVDFVRSIATGKGPNGLYRNIPVGGEVDEMTSSTPLAADATFTSAVVSATGYVTLGISVRSDQNSAIDGLTVSWWGDSAGTELLRAVPLTYSLAPDGAFYQLPVQGPYVNVAFLNAGLGQNVFEFHGQLDVSSPVALIQGAKEPVKDRLLAMMTRAIVTLRQEDGTYITSAATDSGNLRVSLEESNADQQIAPMETWQTQQANVASTAPVQILSSPLSGRRTFKVKNLGVGEVYLRPTSDVSDSNSWVLDSRESITLDLDEGASVWALGDDVGALTAQTRQSGDTVTNNGATNPNNALAADDTRASLTGAGQSIEVSGYAAPGTYPEVEQVVIGFEGRKAGAPTTETVAHVATVTGTSGSGTAVTSATVVSAADRHYIVATSRKDEAALVSGIVGLGLTWSEVATVASPADDVRTSVWQGSGTPTGDGTVTVNFTQSHGGAVVAVSSFTGVSSVDPIDNSETVAPGSSSSSYSDALDGTDDGLIYVAVGCKDRTHSAGSGSTERADVGSGSDAHLAVTTRGLTTTGSASYSGTLSGSVGWALVALTLTPAPAANPTVTLSYELAGTPGATNLAVELSSASDGDHTVDVTGDQAFTAADIGNLSIFVTGSTIAAVPAEIDHVFIDLTEAETGATQRVAWVELA